VAYGNERPVLSGGRRISGWKPVTVSGRQMWAAEIPEVKEGKWFFKELWVNGQRAVRTRHPNQGYLRVEALVDSAQHWLQGDMRFRFFEGDLEDWKTLTQADLIVMTRWMDSHLPVAFIEPAERVVTFSKRSAFALMPDDLYYLEGAFEALDQPGEWYLEPHGGILYYMPRPGEEPSRVEVIAPRLAQVMRFEGRPEADQLVRAVWLRGLTFAHTEWFGPDRLDALKGSSEKEFASEPEAGAFGQAAAKVPGAVWGEGVQDCLFEECSFGHLGTYGLELARGCRQNRVSHCEFFDLGAGGVKVGETIIRKQPAEQTRDNEISDCHIHDGGKVFHNAVGIWLGQSADNEIVHNLIHDFYYTGISLGWTWGYGPALATNNLVAWNHVHHLGRKSDGTGPILSDMGGVYTLGMQPGTRILNNLWHDIAGRQYGGWGIYLDEGVCGVTAESNVVYRTTHGGFEHHYGATNIIRNNIFAFARDQQLQLTRPEPHVSFHFHTNIVYFDSGVLLGEDWSQAQFQMDHNVYYDARSAASPEGMRFGETTLEQWRGRGHDVHSLFVDPRFRAPQKYDFRLRADSPALRLGFQPIDLSRVGVRSKPGMKHKRSASKLEKVNTWQQ
ncbi:MAG TPA: right-handed parallel beta-helix repeat-containing protein, partial [Clostridia bacterium]|nr:right-handed parallel beta-helix repeat-containing protein [Clostridia bacterium]